MGHDLWGDLRLLQGLLVSDIYLFILLFCSSCFNGDHRLDKPGIELLSLAVLHQGINKLLCHYCIF